MKKKLSPFIVFPIVLCSTCLVCGGALAGVNYLVSDKIASNGERKFNRAVDSFFKSSKEKNDIEITEESDSHILKIVEVLTSDDKKGYAYKIETDVGYSGSMTLAVGILGDKIIGLKYISGSEDTLGVDAVNRVANYINGGNTYSLSDDFDGFTLAAGASAKATFPVVLNAMRVAMADADSRAEPSGFDVSFTAKSLNLEKQVYHAVVESNNQYAAIEVDLEVNIANSKAGSKRTITGFTVTKQHEQGEGSGYGKEMLAGTASDSFTETYIKPILSADGLKLNTISKRLDILESENPEIFSNAAPNTAKAFYSILNGFYSLVTASGYRFEDVVKLSDTQYTSLLFESRNSYTYRMQVNVEVDLTKNVFTSMEIVNANAAPYEGDNYGEDIINGNESSGNASRDNFVKTYVKVPEGGLSFSLFEKPANKEENADLITGASETSTSYYLVMKNIVDYINNGGNN